MSSYGRNNQGHMLFATQAPLPLDGTIGDDTIFGNGGDNRLTGSLGDDLLYGRAGNDVLLGDTDDSSIFEQGNDTLRGGSGNDLLFGGNGNDVMNGGTGTDMAVFACESSQLALKKTAWGWIAFGPDGLDRLVDVERIAVDDGVFEFDSATNSWHKISNAPGMAFINPEDVLNGTAGDDVINTITTHPVKTIVRGFGGDDDIRGGGLLLGGAGNDAISSAELAFGIDARARMYGGSGDDGLSGGKFDDYLSGGTGNDRLNGGRGNDVLSGGAGADLFSFYRVEDLGHRLPWGNDIVTDFKVGVDHLSVDELTDLTLTHRRDGLLITLDAGSTIFLKGVIDPHITLDDLLL